MGFARVIRKNTLLKNRYETFEVRSIDRCSTRQRSTEIPSRKASDNRLVANCREMIRNDVGNPVTELPHRFAIEIERRPAT